jgi:hypothetical protein
MINNNQKFNKYVAFIIINSFDIKNKIEAMFAKPAKAFIRYEHIY